MKCKIFEAFQSIQSMTWNPPAPIPHSQFTIVQGMATSPANKRYVQRKFGYSPE